MIHYKLMLCFVLGLELVSCHSLKAHETKLSRATPAPSSTKPLKTSQGERDAFEPPPQEDAPQQTTGGGSRDRRHCASNLSRELPLTALVPTQGFGLTSSPRPELPIYIPATTAKNLELSLFDENHRGLYQTTIPLPGKARIVNIILPKIFPALKIGKKYYWSVAMICDPSDRLKDRVVRGAVKRIELENSLLKQKVESTVTPSLKLISFYQKAGLWYETMAILLAARQTNPDNPHLQEIWQNILNSAGLEQLATKQVTQSNDR